MVLFDSTYKWLSIQECQLVILGNLLKPLINLALGPNTNEIFFISHKYASGKNFQLYLTYVLLRYAKSTRPLNNDLDEVVT